MTQGSSLRTDLFRIGKSKEIVGVTSNTLRAFHADGLPFYHVGKMVFASVTEVEQFIKKRATQPRVKKKTLKEQTLAKAA